MDRPLSVVCIRGRTSDRTDGAGAGAEELARLLGGRVVGEASPGRPRDWSVDLPDAAPALAAAAAELDAAFDAGAVPVLTASDCTICIATFPVVARRVPDVRFLWMDAHGDYNSPETTPSGFLGGMCLAAVCGRWGEFDAVESARVSFVGVRELDAGEKDDVAASGIGGGVPSEGPVYVHLDVDVIDPAELPSQFPVPDGMSFEQVRDVLEQLGDRIVGIEVTALEDPGYAPKVAEIVRSVC
jgi:arginase family enzyme